VNPLLIVPEATSTPVNSGATFDGVSRMLYLLRAGQESGLRDFISATAKNAPAREGAFVLPAAGPVFKPRHSEISGTVGGDASSCAASSAVRQ
jgi:hypothetical protein